MRCSGGSWAVPVQRAASMNPGEWSKYGGGGTRHAENVKESGALFGWHYPKKFEIKYHAGDVSLISFFGRGAGRTQWNHALTMSHYHKPSFLYLSRLRNVNKMVFCGNDTFGTTLYYFS